MSPSVLTLEKLRCCSHVDLYGEVDTDAHVIVTDSGDKNFKFRYLT